MSQRPVHVIRFGLIKACIWQNRTKSGDRHSVTVCRLYRDGNVWKESTGFGRDDLLRLAKAFDQAHTWVCEMTQSGSSSVAAGGKASQHAAAFSE